MTRYRLYQAIDGKTLRSRTFSTLAAAKAAIQVPPWIGSNVSATICQGSRVRVVAEWTSYGWADTPELEAHHDPGLLP